MRTPEEEKQRYYEQAALFSEAAAMAISALELAIAKQPELKKYFDSAVELAKKAQEVGYETIRQNGTTNF